jgi:hypothetical protein
MTMGWEEEEGMKRQWGREGTERRGEDGGDRRV